MKHNESPPDLQSQAITDLHADIAEKSTLLSSLLTAIPRRDPAVEPIRTMIGRLTEAQKFSDPQTLRALKRDGLVLYRTHLVESASRAVSPNWQSPSAIHTLYDEAGNESGRITMTMNDYKRDYHADAIPYEQAFRRAYIDGLMTLGVHTYLVSSGMAGLTTIISYLQGEKFLTGPVIVGENTYFQSKGLIVAWAGKRAIQVREADTDAIVLLITTKKPNVIFLDSLTNSASMSAPDLPAILNQLVTHTHHDMALVVDNTGLSIGFQPMKTILGRNRHLRLVVYESLNKFHEFGADRVTAGIIWAYGPGTEKLFDYRKNCGTIITDLSAHCLPTPNRKLLERRLNRMNRNAQYLSQSLKKTVDVAYAEGSLIGIRFGSTRQTIKKSQIIIKRAIENANKQHVPLVAGTSFGFDTTRIYLTASNTDYGEPFFRIAAGTEDMDTLDRLASILEYAMKHA